MAVQGVSGGGAISPTAQLTYQLWSGETLSASDTQKTQATSVALQMMQDMVQISDAGRAMLAKQSG